MIRTVYFDVETGGLEPGRHPIIQFAAVAIDPEWNELEALEFKLQFDLAACEPSALEKNHYSAEAWLGALAAPVALRRIADFLKRFADVEKISKGGKPYRIARVAAHNAPLDCDHLGAFFKARNEFLPAAIYEPLDTLSLARWYSAAHPSPPSNHKLETLCAWLGVPLDNAHDALSDVRATVVVAQILCQRLGISAAADRKE